VFVIILHSVLPSSSSAFSLFLRVPDQNVHQELHKTAVAAASGLLSELGDSSDVGRGRASRPDHDQQHCYHHAPTVKSEAAAAVVELLEMGVRTPETCSAAQKHQVINLRNCCI
jgi:hypothetical protein